MWTAMGARKSYWQAMSTRTTGSKLSVCEMGRARRFFPDSDIICDGWGSAVQSPTCEICHTFLQLRSKVRANRRVRRRGGGLFGPGFGRETSRRLCRLRRIGPGSCEFFPADLAARRLGLCRGLSADFSARPRRPRLCCGACWLDRRARAVARFAAVECARAARLGYPRRLRSVGGAAAEEVWCAWTRLGVERRRWRRESAAARRFRPGAERRCLARRW